MAVNEILKVAMTDPLAEISGWKEVDRLDVRPSKGMVKVQSINGYEVQIDLATMEIMQSKYRRSDWIEQLHDGSFFRRLGQAVGLPGEWSRIVSIVGFWRLPLVFAVSCKIEIKATEKGDV